MEINIKLLSDFAKIPTRGSTDAAGYDLYIPDAEEPYIYAICPGQTVKIPIDIAVEIPRGYFGAIVPRSGLSIKKGLRLANSIGIIDSDYRGDIIVALHNDSEEDRFIRSGERIAQLIIIPYMNVDFNIVEKLEETERGDGSLGSTGER